MKVGYNYIFDNFKLMALFNVLITLNFYIVNAIFCQTFNLKISSSVALIDILLTPSR